VKIITVYVIEDVLDCAGLLVRGATENVRLKGALEIDLLS